ncbi:hypothetical protein KY284_032641 [Solanum tuberosum]|nr:hypothetical protein KY284_032641 [Solanum tuberosum]
MLVYWAMHDLGIIDPNVWGHSTSSDLVNWTIHPPTLLPSEPYDINGCWSGSATILKDGTLAILYTGIDSNNNQVQNLAMPKIHQTPIS